jgi:prepilin-type N-terminal cleavage/methylation domain-containing protein
MKIRLNHAVHQNQESGMTIVEVLIAIVVLSVGLVSIAGMSAYVSRMNNTSNNLNILAATAQDQVDRLRSAIWTQTTEDPMIAIGGSLPASVLASAEGLSTDSEEMRVVGLSVATASPTTPYTYTLDTSTYHQATVSNTPIGNLVISWQVRQSSADEADLRYVTINVVQDIPAVYMKKGFTVTTILHRG